jgi:hypothetical protein
MIKRSNRFFEVGPVELDYEEEAVWNRAASKFLYILDLELVFTRQEGQPSSKNKQR